MVFVTRVRFPLRVVVDTLWSNVGWPIKEKKCIGKPTVRRNTWL